MILEIPEDAFDRVSQVTNRHSIDGYGLIMVDDNPLIRFINAQMKRKDIQN